MDSCCRTLIDTNLFRVQIRVDWYLAAGSETTISGSPISLWPRSFVRGFLAFWSDIARVGRNWVVLRGMSGRVICRTVLAMKTVLVAGVTANGSPDFGNWTKHDPCLEDHTAKICS